MEYIKGFTFQPFSQRGRLKQKNAFDSLLKMKKETNANFVIFAPAGLQAGGQAEVIDYASKQTPSDEELIAIIHYARKIGLRVGLKPTVNCLNGLWRAHINFFDEDVICEPKWSNWFASYTDFQLHYARIAEETNCEIFIAGCEMVMSERREQQWRDLLSTIRQVYTGLLSYNTDKYQEHNVDWWDAVDIISSSGYYPIDDWENQLDRIEKVVQRFDKPFFFAEAGCMSAKGAAGCPNNWELEGQYSEEEQADWYDQMLSAVQNRPWMNGLVIWDWRIDAEKCKQEKANYYDVQGKIAQTVIAKAFK